MDTIFLDGGMTFYSLIGSRKPEPITFGRPWFSNQRLLSGGISLCSSLIPAFFVDPTVGNVYRMRSLAVCVTQL